MHRIGYDYLFNWIVIICERFKIKSRITKKKLFVNFRNDHQSLDQIKHFLYT